MTVVLIHIKTKDYSAWKTTFDTTAAARTTAGLTNFRILRSSDNANEVFVQSETSDLAKTKQFLSSPDVRMAMEKAGVIGPPTIHFLNPT